VIVLVWLSLVVAAGCLLLASFKVQSARINLESLGLLFWLLAVILMKV
jgi:hypothetical protein